jgi:hypothetical protein
MNAEQKTMLAEAVNTLIDDTDALDLYKKMMGVHELARKGYPVRLAGRCDVLNPMLDLLLVDHDGGEAVLRLIEVKRTARGLPPLEDAEQARRDYMRELMADRRDRLSRLVKLWNMMRPAHEQIRGPARAEFERVHGNRWFAVREEREKALREQLGRRLMAHERAALLTAFWADVNAELDELEVFVRNQMKSGAARNAVFQFKLQPRKE